MTLVTIKQCFCCGHVMDGKEIFHPIPDHFKPQDERLAAEFEYVCDCCLENTDWELTTEFGLWAWMLEQSIRLNDYYAAKEG